jgi:hypothetical protein
MCRHRFVLLNNEKSCREISEDKISVDKTARVYIRSGNFSDLNSACSKVLVPVKIFQNQNMLNENRFLRTFKGTTHGLFCQNPFYRFEFDYMQL